jgi:hypothetical protein
MKIFPPDTESETLNAGALATGQVVHRERVAQVAGTVASLAGLPDPEADAKKVCRARQALCFLACWRPSPRTCQPWPTFSAYAASTPSRYLHPPANDLGACCPHSRRGVALDMSEPQPGYRPWPSNQ